MSIDTNPSGKVFTANGIVVVNNVADVDPRMAYTFANRQAALDGIDNAENYNRIESLILKYLDERGNPVLGIFNGGITDGDFVPLTGITSIKQNLISVTLTDLGATNFEDNIPINIKAYAIANDVTKANNELHTWKVSNADDSESRVYIIDNKVFNSYSEILDTDIKLLVKAPVQALTATEDLTVSGNYELDLDTFDVSRLRLTGDTNLTITNTPTSEDKAIIKRLQVLSANFTEKLNLPFHWRVYGEYEPLASNFITLVIREADIFQDVDCIIDNNLDDIIPLSYDTTTSLELGFETFDEEDALVNWGNGDTELISSSADGSTRITKNFDTAQAGVVLVYKAKNIKAIRSFKGTWDFKFDVLPDNLLFMEFWGSTKVSDDIANLPKNLTHVGIRGTNTCVGNLVNLPRNLTYVSLGGANYITGNLIDLPKNLITYQHTGSNNTVYGNIKDLPETLEFFTLNGQNEVIGEPSDLKPAIKTFDLSGNHNFTGNIDGFPNGMTRISVSGGFGSLTGDINTLPNTLQTFRNSTNNTIYGLIENISNTFTSIIIDGQNTVSGNIENVHEGIIHIRIWGNTTITGNIANSPSTLNKIEIDSDNNTLTYSLSTGRVWSGNLNVHSVTINSFTSAMVDNYLIDISTGTWVGSGTFRLTSDQGAVRTSASDSAVALLQSKNVTVTLN